MSERAPETIGEIGIMLVNIQKSLDDVVNRSVTQTEFQSEKERTREELADVRSDHQAWTVESRGAHVELDGKIEALRKELREAQTRQDDLERASKNRTWDRVLVVSGWVAVALIGLGVWLFQRALTGGL